VPFPTLLKTSHPIIADHLHIVLLRFVLKQASGQWRRDEHVPVHQQQQNSRRHRDVFNIFRHSERQPF